MTTAEQSFGALSPAPSDSDRPASLECLPDELIQLIISNLPFSDLRNAALVSKCIYRHATDVLWHSVCLSDTWKLHLNDETSQLWGERGQGEPDEHDDTPIIQKLYILATNPIIASKVQILTHRCHLPTPNIFTELPRMYFHAKHLSQDARLHSLLMLAIPNLVNVHTLRIVYGHLNLTRTLLEGFLDPNRPRRIPLRKLWLESCSLLGIGTGFLSPGYLTGLESIRIRRLRAESMTSGRSKMRFLEFKLSRGGQHFELHNGAGGWFGTTVEFSGENFPMQWHQFSQEELQAKADEFDALTWKELPEIQDYVDENMIGTQTPRFSPAEPMLWLLETSASTLTSLNLDWILWRQREGDDDFPALCTMQALARLRFPHLRAFQVRNAVVPQAKLPDGVFLLEDMFLDFLVAHPKIQCLAWPLDRFYSHLKPSTETQNRTRKLVAHLGMMLVDLRLDSYYAGNGETFTDESRELEEQQERIRRRRFINEFAPSMGKITQVKLEGGIPRDEKREILRALHYSPLKKIVLIGVSFPIGNTWGLRGEELKRLDPGQGSDATYNLEEEDLDAILNSYRSSQALATPFKFEPFYGWPPEPPFLQTLALHHADTVEELKLCGYNGSPVLSYQTAITNPLLYPLRHFYNLRQLVISFWLLTWFEDSYRDTEIIQSWMDTRSPTSTALVVVTPPSSPPALQSPVDPTTMPDFPPPVARHQEFNRWQVALKTRFTPSALAYRVARDIGEHLNPIAKERPGGVRVRASFCLGNRDGRRPANDIFDLDIRIGKGDQVLEFVGPREEGEKRRWWQKLEARRWF